VLCNGDECEPRKISDALLHVLFRYFHEQQTVQTLTQDGLSLA
jgi:hypothetical protein